MKAIALLLGILTLNANAGGRGDAAAPDPVCRRTEGRTRLDELLRAEGNAPDLEAARWRRIGG